ncbi:hypothetical protein [Peribacillus glennii]|uniref:Uncharacterized protein n=1 Tax=Peribacillus glennii TaxID=2303991 RepID=A0A372LG04_9BACI|nr:hypothetical protein [Peribacillus glennii]RFU65220.1 hypothetical protein D0466_04765 [Peribacillus glennii]
METITVDKIKFKEKLSMIEQLAIKEFMNKWVGRSTVSIDDFLPLEYKENVFAKMEAKKDANFIIHGDEQFRYATLTEDNQIIIGVLNSNKELTHRTISLDEV